MQRRGLVVMGMQEGLFGRHAAWHQTDAHGNEASHIASRIDQLLDHADQSWLKSIHVAMELEPQEASQPAAQAIVAGSPGVALLDSFASRHPRMEQLQAIPGRDAFRGSDLDQVLGEHGIGQIVIAGPTIAGMLDDTCRTAYALGYEVVVPADCLLASSEVERKIYVETVLAAYVRVMDVQDIIGVAA